MKARYWDDTLALFTPIYWRIRWRYYWAERARRRGDRRYPGITPR